MLYGYGCVLLMPCLLACCYVFPYGFKCYQSNDLAFSNMQKHYLYTPEYLACYLHFDRMFPLNKFIYI